MGEFIIDRETGEIREQEGLKLEEYQQDDFFSEESGCISNPWKLEVEEVFWKGAEEFEEMPLNFSLLNRKETESYENEAENGHEKNGLKTAFLSNEPGKTEKEISSKTTNFSGDTLGGRAARKENLDGGTRFCLQEPWTIPRYLKTIMEQNLCSDFLHMSFLQIGGENRIYYDCSGYLQLGEYLKQWKGTPQDFCAEALRILSEISRCLLRAENHLVRIGDMVLLPDTVFIHKESTSVKLAFCPTAQMRNEEAHCPDPGESLAKIISYMEDVCRDSQWSIFGNSLRRQLRERKLSVREALRLFRLKEGEVFDREWKKESPADVAEEKQDAPQTDFLKTERGKETESWTNYFKRLKTQFLARS